MALASGVRAAVYCRLSKDDDLETESASISNQKEMLQQFCAKNGWEVTAVFQDDGFTGLNMDRPGLKKMLHAIEKGAINLVVTKDLSRLGRNYLETGRVIEDFFPRHGVRYIAMNDGIDTMRENNEIAPFKNILNEIFSLSREIDFIQCGPRTCNIYEFLSLSSRLQSDARQFQSYPPTAEGFHDQVFQDHDTGVSD